MNRKRIWLLLAVLLVALTALVLLSTVSREPGYKGKRLSQWLQKFNAEETARSGAMWQTGQERYSMAAIPATEAVEAVRHIGKDALPWLVKWLQYEPPAWQFKLVNFLEQKHVPFRNFLEGLIFRGGPRDDFNKLALAGFKILGSDAAPAVPELVPLLPRMRWPYSYFPLFYIGPEGLPPLMAAVADPRFPGRIESIAYFRSLNLCTNGWFAVPVLIGCVNDGSPRVAESAVWALTELELPPEIVLPAMRKAMEDSRWKIRYVTIQALGRLGRQALSCTGLLTNCFSDPEQPIREAATNALNRIMSEDKG